MVYFAAFVQFAHIMFAISWFGSSIFINSVMIPAIRRLSPAATKEYLTAVGATSKVFFPVAGVGTVVLGIVRGFLFGFSLDTAYGITFVIAAVLGVAVLLYGALVTGRNVQAMSVAPEGPEQRAALEHTASMGRIELAGFGILLILMVAMRFSY